MAIWITDPDPDRDTGKTCPGGGMHCLSASSSLLYAYVHKNFCRMQVLVRGTHYWFMTSMGVVVNGLWNYYISRESQTMRNVLWSRVSVCVSVCLRPHAHTICMDPDVIWGSGRGCPLVVQIRFTILALYKLVCMYVHYWVDLQLVHGLCCYGNISWTVVTNLPSSLI